MYYPVVIGPDCSMRWIDARTKKLQKRDSAFLAPERLQFTTCAECIVFLQLHTDENLVGAIYDTSVHTYLHYKIVGKNIYSRIKWQEKWENPNYLTDEKEPDYPWA